MKGSVVKEDIYSILNQRSINVLNLPHGVYSMKVEGDKINHSQKLIIKK